MSDDTTDNLDDKIDETLDAANEKTHEKVDEVFDKAKDTAKSTVKETKKLSAKVKTHLKKYQTYYIVGGSVAAGVIIGVVVTKKFSVPQVPSLENGVAALYQIGGPSSPLKFALTPPEAAAYNRVASDILMNGVTKLPGTDKSVLVSKLGTHADMKVYNAIGALINDYIKRNGEISLEVFDINRALFEQVV